MNSKTFLLDLDNTLYDYKTAHEPAKSALCEKISELFQIENNLVWNSYESARKKVNTYLSGTASSHNRLLYIQNMFEELGIPYSQEVRNLSKYYWDIFLLNTELFPGVLDFFKKVSGAKVGLVTDLTADIQFLKLERLGLVSLFDAIVTSEESGREKPHPYNFQLALLKLGSKLEDTIMIGDDFEKDILGASNLGMKTIWLNHAGNQENLPKDSTEVISFTEILNII